MPLHRKPCGPGRAVRRPSQNRRDFTRFYSDPDLPRLTFVLTLQIAMRVYGNPTKTVPNVALKAHAARPLPEGAWLGAPDDS